MPTITATTYPAEAYVRVDVSWADVPEVEYARVWRVNTVTGEEVLLRPYVAYNDAGDLLLLCGEGIWWDTDPPLNVPVVYRTEAADVLTNLAANSSFEAGTAPWTVFGGALAQSATFAHAGANSGRLTPTGSSFNSFIRQTGVVVDPAKPVTASTWALSSAGWNSVQLQVQFFGAGAVPVGPLFSTPLEILDDAEWRYLALPDLTPPDGTVDATITVRVTGTAPALNLFYFDQVEVAQYTTVTAYALTAPVTVTPDFPWYLKDPINPCHDRAMTRCMPGPVCSTDPGMMVQNHAQRESYAARTRLLAAENRYHDVPLVRERADAETVLSVITRTFADRDLLKITLQPGTILFLQGPPEYGIPDRYISAGAVQIDCPVPDKRIQPRFFTIPYSTQDRPNGEMNGPCGIRIDDLCDRYASWAAIEIAGLTWEDLLLGMASYSAPGWDTTGWRTFDQVKAEFPTFNAVNTGGRDFVDLLAGA